MLFPEKKKKHTKDTNFLFIITFYQHRCIKMLANITGIFPEQYVHCDIKRYTVRCRYNAFHFLQYPLGCGVYAVCFKPDSRPSAVFAVPCILSYYNGPPYSGTWLYVFVNKHRKLLCILWCLSRIHKSWYCDHMGVVDAYQCSCTVIQFTVYNGCVYIHCIL